MKKLIEFIKSLFAKTPAAPAEKETYFTKSKESALRKAEQESFKQAQIEAMEKAKAQAAALEGIATVVESTTKSPIIKEALEAEAVVEEYEISEEEYQQEVAAGSKDVVSEDQGDPIPVRKKRVTRKKKK